jgi:hypothetical protein
MKNKSFVAPWYAPLLYWKDSFPISRPNQSWLLYAKYDGVDKLTLMRGNDLKKIQISVSQYFRPGKHNKSYVSVKSIWDPNDLEIVDWGKGLRMGESEAEVQAIFDEYDHLNRHLGM